MRTQRASSPQMLALVVQLVSLGSVGDKSGPSLLSHLGLGLGSLALRRPPAASSLARRAHRCCSPPHQSRPRSHRTCCSAARRTGSAGSGTETPSCLCSGGSGPWGALGKVGASDLEFTTPGPPPTAPPPPPAPSQPPAPHCFRGCLSSFRGCSTSRPRAPGSLPAFLRSLSLPRKGPQTPHNGYYSPPTPTEFPPGPPPPTVQYPNYRPRPARLLPLAPCSPQSSSSVPSPQLSVPSHWRPIHRQTRSFLQRKGRLGGHTNLAAGVGGDRARISLGGGPAAPGEHESPAPRPGPRPPSLTALLRVFV